MMSNAYLLLYRKHIFAVFHNGHADGKHCSKACLGERCFVTAEIAVLNGTALIAA